MSSESRDAIRNRMMRLIEIGIIVSSELNLDVLLEKVVHHARELTSADGGTLYLLEDNHLHGQIVQNQTLGIYEGGTTGNSIKWPPVPLVKSNVSAYSVLEGKTVKIDNIYESEDFNFAGPSRFDQEQAYQTRSMLVVPMKNHNDNVIGALLLINATDPKTGEVSPFPEEDVSLVEMLASQAAVAITNVNLVEETRALNKALNKASDQLERRVKERTAELASANEQLKIEVTERKQAETASKKARDEAEIANRAKGEFLANMSHELRTPLNAIIGYVQILRKEQELTEKQKQGLNTIHRSGDHLLGLINGILDFSKIEMGKMELTLTDFHLSEMLQNVADVFRRQAEKKDIAFLFERIPNLPNRVRGDEQKIRQILMNLLSNALKLTDEGNVVFKIARKGGKIRFEVSDTGIGIADDSLTLIFGAFQQVGEKSRVIEGTGLGLTISSELVAAMGGELRVKSALSEGSTFWFELELPEMQNMAEATSPDERIVTGYEGERQRILIVDDEENNRQMLRNIFVPLGFELRDAVDGKDALVKIREFEPNLILMDLRMPDMDGFEATRQIRQLPEGEDVKIITITASAFDFNRQESLAAGSNDFIAKPFQLDALLSLLQKHLTLQWIYEEQEQAAEACTKVKPNTSQSASLALPPEQDLVALLDLAKRGNIKAILAYADKLPEQDANFEAFAQELRGLAQSFNTRALKAFIEGC